MSTQDVTQPISERLKSWREALGLSQEQAAQRIGVSYGAYVHWEQRTRTPTKLYAQAVEKALQSTKTQ